MLTLGIDPGSRHTGYAFIRAEGSSLTALAYGRISCKPRAPLADRLAYLSRELTQLVNEWQPEVAALETTFHGLNTRSLIVLAQARGCLLAVLGMQGLPVREYAPAEVKTAVTGHGRADKGQVGRMVRLMLALGDAEISEDASDALALAICCAHRRRHDELTSR